MYIALPEVFTSNINLLLNLQFFTNLSSNLLTTIKYTRCIMP